MLSYYTYHHAFAFLIFCSVSSFNSDHTRSHAYPVNTSTTGKSFTDVHYRSITVITVSSSRCVTTKHLQLTTFTIFVRSLSHTHTNTHTHTRTHTLLQGAALVVLSISSLLAVCPWSNNPSSLSTHRPRPLISQACSSCNRAVYYQAVHR